MRSRNDKTFSNIPIHRLDPEQRSEMYAEALDSSKGQLAGLVDQYFKQDSHTKAVGGILLGLFVLAVIFIVIFANAGNGTAAFAVFFGLIAILGLASVLSGDEKAKGQRRGYFAILGFGAGGLITCLLKMFDPFFAEVNFIVMLVIFMFGTTGIALLLSVFSGFGMRTRKYSAKVSAECTGYQYALSNDVNNENSGRHGPLLVCAPVYTYMYGGERYTAYDESGMNSVEVLVGLGERREIYVDPHAPEYCAEKASASQNALLVIISLLVIGAAVFAGYFYFRSQTIMDSARDGVEIVMQDGKTVLTQELLQADRQANIEYNASVMRVLFYVFLALCAAAVFAIIKAVGFYRRGLRLNRENNLPASSGNRFVAVLAALFMFAMCGLFAMLCAKTMRDEQAKSGTPITLEEHYITGNDMRREYDSSSDTHTDHYYLVTDDGEELEVSYDVCASVKVTGIYYMSVSESGNYIMAYYSGDYVPES